jgi:hypothetical protein
MVDGMTFKHCIITRFNVPINSTPYALRLSEAWLADRFDLFSTFCLPSVMGQDCQNFTWLVLFDEQTPDKFKRLVASLRHYKNFVPLFCSDFPSILPRVSRFLAATCRDADYCLSTRLDNDDALSRKFVAVLHNAVENILATQDPPPPELYINFPNGLQYSEGRLYDFFDPTNAFVSLLERNTPPRTVHWVEHPSIYDVAPVAQIETKPLFLQTVHGLNLYNYIRGDVLEDREILAEFSLGL